MKSFNPLTAYEYLFYRIFLWQKTFYKNDYTPRLVAFLAVSFLLYLNVMTLFVCFQIIAAQKIRLENANAFIPALAVVLINYFIFIYEKNRIKTILRQFHTEGDPERKRRTTWCWVYALLTHLSFFISVIILNPRSR